MKHSKLLQVPEFSKLPDTNAANVEENIVHWITKGDRFAIDTFLRPDSSRPNGFRFVSDADFTEIKTVNQVISKVPVSVKYTRKAHRANISFYPLGFSLWYIDAIVTIGNESFNFESDAHLKRKIKEHK
jgi:hypothetical protein